MNTFDSEAIAAATGGVVLGEGPAGPITANNQTMAAGEWFVALAGPGFDDHAFVPEAAERGAAGVVVEHRPDGVDVPVVLVPDTWRALRQLANAARHRFSGPVVAVTGSSGKTTTRILVALALSPLGEVYQTAANHNNQPGVPLTLLDCPETARAQVLELGTAMPGEIERLAHTVDPDVRLITNVGPAHLARLGTVEGVAVEKGALFRTARPGDICVANVDDPRVSALSVPSGVRRVTYGTGGEVELIDAVLIPETLDTRARWRTPLGEVTARLPSPARYVAHDAAGALAVAWALGVDPAAAAAALEHYSPLGSRLRPQIVPPGATVLDDAFNANPRSMAAALHLLGSLDGRRAAVIGDMLDLGPAEAQYHLEAATLAAGLGLELLILVGPRMTAARHAAPGALAFVDPTEAIEPLRGWLQAGDRVLLKASHGMHLERVMAGLQDALRREP